MFFPFLSVKIVFFVKHMQRIWCKVRLLQFSHKVEHIWWTIIKFYYVSNFLAICTWFGDSGMLGPMCFPLLPYGGGGGEIRSPWNKFLRKHGGILGIQESLYSILLPEPCGYNARHDRRTTLPKPAMARVVSSNREAIVWPYHHRFP